MDLSVLSLALGLFTLTGTIAAGTFAARAHRVAQAAGRRAVRATEEARSHRREVNNLTVRLAKLEHHSGLGSEVVHQRDDGTGLQAVKP